MFSFSSGIAALANRQYRDRFSQHGFDSASAIPLWVLWTYYCYVKFSQRDECVLNRTACKENFFFFSVGEKCSVEETELGGKGNT